MASYAHRKKDNVTSILSTLGIFVLLIILLKFLVYRNEVEQPLEDVIEIDKTPDEIVMHDFETSVKQGGGSGTPTDAPKGPDTPQMEKTIRNANSDSKESAAKGESNHSNQNKSSDNKAQTADPSLGFHGSGGKGGGDGTGKGKGFGNDEGDGSGPGKGEGKKPRIRLTNPNNDNISSDESCRISLKLTINAEGDVVKGENISAKTTTTNQKVISQVIANVKAQVKYNASPGTALEVVFLTVSVSAN